MNNFLVHKDSGLLLTDMSTVTMLPRLLTFAGFS